MVGNEDRERIGSSCRVGDTLTVQHKSRRSISILYPRYSVSRRPLIFSLSGRNATIGRWFPRSLRSVPHPRCCGTAERHELIESAEVKGATNGPRNEGRSLRRAGNDSTSCALW